MEQQSSFSNREAVLCWPGDERLGAVWNEYGGFEQGEEGPVMLVLGVLTDDAKCERMAARFGVDAAELKAKRDARNRTTVDPVDPITGRRSSDVEFFCVVVDRMVDGRQFWGDHLSPIVRTMATAKVAYSKLKAQYPDCGIGGGVRFFNPLSPASMAERADFIRLLDANEAAAKIDQESARSIAETITDRLPVVHEEPKQGVTHE